MTTLNYAFLKSTLSETLTRLRAVTMKSVVHQLTIRYRMIRGLQLIHRFCPSNLVDVCPQADSWPGILESFLHWIDSDLDWFELDWEDIHQVYDMAIQDELNETTGDPDDGPPAWSSPVWENVALLLQKIPVMSYGILLNEDDDGHGSEEKVMCCFGLHRTFPFRLLRALLGQRPLAIPVSDGFKTRIKLPRKFSWNSESKKAAWRQVYTMNPTDFPEPLCWLPQVALFACGVSGNPLLDRLYTPEDWNNPAFYSWDRPEDIDRLRQLSAQARGIVDLAYEFVNWAEKEENVKKVFQLVTSQATDQLPLPGQDKHTVLSGKELACA